MNTRVLLARRPTGWVDESCFAVERCADPVCGPGDVLLQAVYLSTDPYLRGRMNAGPSYAPGFELGRPIVSRVVARVLQSRHAGLAEGEWVQLPGLGRTLRRAPWRGCRHRPGAGPPQPLHLGARHAGADGLDRRHRDRPPAPGRHGLRRRPPAPWASSQGSSPRAGARVVGSAGSDDKVAYVRERLRL